MKKFKLLIGLVSVLFQTHANESVQDSFLITQEIRYNCPEAREVFFVWGVNNWQNQEKVLWPGGTYQKGALLSTQMKNEDGVFTIQLKTKPNTMIDYVFWITKGPKDIPSDIWDVNTKPQKDYHTFAINDNVTIINSKVNVKPVQPISLLEYAWQFLFFSVVLFIIAFLTRKYFFKNVTLSLSKWKVIAATGFTVFLVLMVVRTSVTRHSWDLYYNKPGSITTLLWTAYYDHLFIFAITCIFILLFFAFRKFSVARKFIVGSFVLVAMVAVIAGLLNIKVVELIGKPFNYRWFYYSGFLNSADSHAALASGISAVYISRICAVCLASALLSVFFVYCIQFISLRTSVKRIALIVLIVLNLGYIFKAKSALQEYDLDYNRLVNPVTAFVESLSLFDDRPQLFTMKVADSLKYKSKKTAGMKSFTSDVSAIKNVILLVLESTAAEYVQPYDTKYKVTPGIEQQLAHAIVFENVYAHAPATNKSMVCLLGSVFPWLSYTSITQEYPAISFPTLSSELKSQGYRTAFFNSGDNHFQRAGEFLQHRNFEHITDYNSMECDVKYEEKDHDWDPLDGVDDACTSNELMKWVRLEPSRPFFAMLWTYQTHYPYYFNGDEKKYVDYDPVFNRYLNAVNHSDKIITQIIEELKKSNLADSTLIVIIGDHGEAFGRHEQTTHASKIYEENVHIPCILIHPSFVAERKKVIGGISDVAPTIMDLLGIKSNQAWQGNSLFNKNYSDRTYFFCPWSDYLFGFREGNMKYIFNATKNSSELYNLEKDPYETTNLAATANLDIYQQKLSGWVQYQDSFMRLLIKENQADKVTVK